MATTPMGARKARVLRAVVGDYIRTAEPVGSGTVATRYRLGVSPATIRNDMATLEELGYLVQPHTSAGRVPTDLGYRFYVDTLPRRAALSDTQRRAIAVFFGEVPPDVEEVLRRTASFLSQLTHYAAVALAPDVERSRVAYADLIPLASGALLVVVGDTGRVDKRLIEAADGVSEPALRRTSEALRRSVAGRSYAEARRRIDRAAAAAAGDDRDVLAAVAQAFADLERSGGPDHAFIGGVANIAGEDAFERRETVRRLFEALEEEAAVLRFLRGLAGEEEVAVTIGRENPVAAMREASVVVAPYRAGHRPAGAIAVIGPTRMHYTTSISAVRAVSRRLSGLIETLAG
ncbi:MAG TPA: heat-inducible transcriptional repressor HrcA [Actinomycetota bacterium]|nr:heat-inducible transcriptional repressor HrcA [Actinomycetota bacterium]